MKNQLFFTIFIVFFLLTYLSCNEQINGLSGTYELRGSLYTIDTLVLYGKVINNRTDRGFKKHRFAQKIYNKKTGKLLLTNEGIWWIQNNRIQFDNFYFNYDNDPQTYSYNEKTQQTNLGSFGTVFFDGVIVLDKTNSYHRINNVF